MDLYHVIIRPLITEKSTDLSERENKYVFEVQRKANKEQIKEAVTKLFHVDVKSVRTISMPRKKRNLGRYQGYKAAWKKAVVEIEEGQKIKIFEETK